jgi:carbonic anhydrase
MCITIPETNVTTMRILLLATLWVALSSVPVFAGEHEEASAEKSLQWLRDGNKRYVSAHYKEKWYRKDRSEQAKGQHPYAIVITCADSRVSPEIMFDESLGRLFVIRVAGNVVDSVILGSVEYAAEHLHVPLVVVLGHTACGAVTAAVNGGDLPPNIQKIVDRIKPSVDRVKSKHVSDKELLGEVIHENAFAQVVAAQEQSAVLAHMSDIDEVSFVSAVYNIESGVVTFDEMSGACHCTKPCCAAHHKQH